LREAQRLASEQARGRRVGETVRVLVEGRRSLRAGDPLRVGLGTAGASFGRSMGEAPGVDGNVYFTRDAEIGSFVDIALDGTTAFDYYGTARERVLVGA
jgi:hypothetical protein